MIGNYDKKRKEQKALLKELESIKSLLDDGELIDDDYSDLAETALKKSSPVAPASVADDLPLIHDEANLDELIYDEADEFLVSDDFDTDLSKEGASIAKLDEVNIPILEEMVVDDGVQAPSAPGALPGQQSLFTENKNEPSTEADKTVKNEKPQPQAEPENKTQKQTPHQKAKSVENPFLPKHIRERLNGTVDVPAYAQPNEVIRNPYVAPNFSYDDRSTEHPPEMEQKHTSPNQDRKVKELNFSPSASLYEPSSNDADHKDMIDALVNEFMPKIESRLRLRLAKVLEKNAKK